MNTFYKSNLAYIMDIFEVTGKELGDFLHVDYSLISKWKNNKRKLNNRSHYLDKIAEYFISLDAYQNHKRLKLLLNCDSSENLDKILKHWLLNSEILNENIDTNLFSNSSKEFRYNASLLVYEGNKGRRNAVLEFLNSILQVKTTPELLLLSQEDMTWLIEDTKFLMQWKELILKIITKGHKITIIHTVDRKYSSIITMLEHWLPLHLTGRITPLYYPKYDEITYKTTLFILKNHFALTGLFIDGLSKKTYTNMISDPLTLNQVQFIFQQFCSQSKALYNPYFPKDFIDLSGEIIQASKREENSYLRMNMPLIYFIPQDSFKLLLKDMDFDNDTAEKLIYYHINSEKSFNKTLPSCFQRHIYSLDFFEKIIENNNLYYNELNMAKKEHIKIPIRYFAQQLETIIKNLKKYPSFEVALTNRPIHKLDNINVLIKENVITFAHSNSQPVDYAFYVSSREATIINSFFKYYNNLWISLPRANKNKDCVITKLENLILKANNRESM